LQNLIFHTGIPAKNHSSTHIQTRNSSNQKLKPAYARHEGLEQGNVPRSSVLLKDILKQILNLHFWNFFR